MADTVQTKVVEVPEVKLARMVVTIQGLTPIITCRFPPEVLDDIAGGQEGKPALKKEPRNPEVEFRRHIHFISEQPQERYGFPAAGMKAALVRAGGRFTEEKMTVLRGVINIVGDLLEIKGSKPTMRSDWVKPQRNVTTIAYRPQWFPWSIDVPVIYNARMITEGELLSLFQQAGFGVGIGSWRPESNGNFGQFTVKGAAQ